MNVESLSSLVNPVIEHLKTGATYQVFNKIEMEMGRGFQDVFIPYVNINPYAGKDTTVYLRRQDEFAGFVDYLNVEVIKNLSFSESCFTDEDIPENGVCYDRLTDGRLFYRSTQEVKVKLDGQWVTAYVLIDMKNHSRIILPIDVLMTDFNYSSFEPVAFSA